MAAEAQVVVNAFLCAWAAALSAGNFKKLSDLFDEFALFVATDPHPLQGRSQIQACYERAPQGLCVQASLLCVTSPTADLMQALAEVEFEASGGFFLRHKTNFVHKISR